MKSIAETRSSAKQLTVRPDRRQNILDASQRLFARYGYHAVTIRQIAAEAKVPLALVGYYFGQKQELYDAVFAHWSSTVEQRRFDLNEALAQTTGDRLHRIIAAMVAPILRLRGTVKGESYALFIARGLSQQGVEEDRAIREYLDPVTTEFIDAIHDALAESFPRLTYAHSAWGFQFALGSLLHFLSDQRVARLSNNVNTAGDPAVEPQLIAFIVHGLRGMAQAFVEATGAGAAAATFAVPAKPESLVAEVVA